jgi:hypothetical protein
MHPDADFIKTADVFTCIVISIKNPNNDLYLAHVAYGDSEDDNMIAKQIEPLKNIVTDGSNIEIIHRWNVDYEEYQIMQKQICDFLHSLGKQTSIYERSCAVTGTTTMSVIYDKDHKLYIKHSGKEKFTKQPEEIQECLQKGYFDQFPQRFDSIDKNALQEYCNKVEDPNAPLQCLINDNETQGFIVNKKDHTVASYANYLLQKQYDQSANKTITVPNKTEYLLY